MATAGAGLPGHSGGTPAGGDRPGGSDRCRGTDGKLAADAGGRRDPPRPRNDCRPAGGRAARDRRRGVRTAAPGPARRIAGRIPSPGPFGGRAVAAADRLPADRRAEALLGAGRRGRRRTAVGHIVPGLFVAVGHELGRRHLSRSRDAGRRRRAPRRRHAGHQSAARPAAGGSGGRQPLLSRQPRLPERADDRRRVAAGADRMP